jgi:hypothetical protein
MKCYEDLTKMEIKEIRSKKHIFVVFTHINTHNSHYFFQLSLFLDDNAFNNIDSWIHEAKCYEHRQYQP